jgi:hypothetical protein
VLGKRGEGEARGPCVTRMDKALELGGRLMLGLKCSWVSCLLAFTASQTFVAQLVSCSRGGSNSLVILTS